MAVSQLGRRGKMFRRITGFVLLDIHPGNIAFRA
jgi:hypothetical protein